MAVWSAPGFLFLPRSWSCTGSILRWPRPQEDASTSRTVGTSQHAQVGEAMLQPGAGRDRDPFVGLGGGSQLWSSVGSRPAPGDILPCTETCPAQHPPAPTVPLPWGRTPRPCWSPGCWDTSRLSTFLRGSAPQPPAAGSPGAQGDCASGQEGLGLPDRMGLVSLAGGGHSCAALGTSPLHSRGDAAGFDPKLPPHWHHPRGPQLPLGSGALSPPACFECALQGRWRGAGGTLLPAGTSSHGR